MSSIIGKTYIPQDNSYVGIYDDEGEKIVAEASLIGNSDEILDTHPLFGVRYKPIYTECKIVSEPFKEEVKIPFIEESLTKFFIKVTAYGLTYRVLWNPGWIVKDAKDIDLTGLSDDELANIILDAQRLLKERDV